MGNVSNLNHSYYDNRYCNREYERLFLLYYQILAYRITGVVESCIKHHVVTFNLYMFGLYNA